MTSSEPSELRLLLSDELLRPPGMPPELLVPLPLYSPPPLERLWEDPPSNGPPPGDDELPGPGGPDWLDGTNAGASPASGADTNGSFGSAC
jgi:hypothetical protein